MKFRKYSQPAELAIERQVYGEGYRYVIGVDEVGRGSWAGPLCLGAVVYDLEPLICFVDALAQDVGSGSTDSQLGSYQLLYVNDSKLLSPKDRVSLKPVIEGVAPSWSVSYASPLECDELGMSEALSLCLDRALLRFDEYLGDALILIDGAFNFSRYPRAKTIIKGDTKSFAIASASILAKVERDGFMESEAVHFPWYCFEKNKGYPSPDHVSALHGVGASQIHRKSWAFMMNLPWFGTTNMKPLQQAMF